MPSPLESFGATVRTLRKERGFTQERLAELCERHPVYVSELERGIKNPSLDSILRLCHAMGVSPGTLMDLAFENKNDEDVLKQQILRLLDGQDHRTLRKLLGIVRAVVAKDTEL